MGTQTLCHNSHTMQQTTTERSTLIFMTQSSANRIEVSSSPKSILNFPDSSMLMQQQQQQQHPEREASNHVEERDDHPLILVRPRNQYRPCQNGRIRHENETTTRQYEGDITLPSSLYLPTLVGLR